MKQETCNYRHNIRRHRPDALNVYHEQRTDVRLENLVVFGNQEHEQQPIEAIASQMAKLQAAYDDRLNLAIIDRALPQESVYLLRQADSVVRGYKSEIADRFESAKKEERDGAEWKLTAHRLLYLQSLPDTAAVLDKQVIDATPKRCVYTVPPKANNILTEALATLPIKEKVLGFQIETKDNASTVSFFLRNDKTALVRVDIKVDAKEQAVIDKTKKDKRILIAVEGDIAGHAVRTLETARALRRLGYEPAIVGSGYYAKPFMDEGFNCLPPFNIEQTAERDRIITQAKGEGRGLFFWSFSTVAKRARAYVESLRCYVQSGVDLFLCDMNPIADIAVTQLQKETGQTFPKLTETHNILLSPTRPMRTLKVNHIPVGELMHLFNNSPLLRTLDPQSWRFKASHFLFNEIADVIMGLPLAVQDRLCGNKKDRVKFTDFMYGRDGTLQFCFTAPDNSSPKLYPVGLQADKGKNNGSDCSELEKQIPPEKAFVLNTQGSTYNKKAWNAVVDGLVQKPDCYAIHGTGVREDQPVPVGENGYKIGYVPGYRLTQLADVVVNHGGFGTISQWLLATAARVGYERQELERLIQTGDNEQPAQFLNNCRGISRSLSLCNTFEQENNARSLNEAGGNNVCAVLPADVLLRSPNSTQVVKDIVGELLERPVSNEERAFWINLLAYESTTSAPAHAALVLERLLMSCN